MNDFYHLHPEPCKGDFSIALTSEKPKSKNWCSITLLSHSLVLRIPWRDQQYIWENLLTWLIQTQLQAQSWQIGIRRTAREAKFIRDWLLKFIPVLTILRLQVTDSIREHSLRLSADSMQWMVERAPCVFSRYSFSSFCWLNHFDFESICSNFAPTLSTKSVQVVGLHHTSKQSSWNARMEWFLQVDDGITATWLLVVLCSNTNGFACPITKLSIQEFQTRHVFFLFLLAMDHGRLLLMNGMKIDSSQIRFGINFSRVVCTYVCMCDCRCMHVPIFTWTTWVVRHKLN